MFLSHTKKGASHDATSSTNTMKNPNLFCFCLGRLFRFDGSCGLFGRLNGLRVRWSTARIGLVVGLAAGRVVLPLGCKLAVVRLRLVDQSVQRNDEGCDIIGRLEDAFRHDNVVHVAVIDAKNGVPFVLFCRATLALLVRWRRRSL